MIYLIHLDRPFHHAKHYLGYCEEGEEQRRLERHRKGDGSKLLRAVNAAGIPYSIVRTWPNADRNQERRFKGHSSTRLCPTCKSLKNKNHHENHH